MSNRRNRTRLGTGTWPVHTRCTVSKSVSIPSLSIRMYMNTSIHMSLHMPIRMHIHRPSYIQSTRSGSSLFRCPMLACTVRVQIMHVCACPCTGAPAPDGDNIEGRRKVQARAPKKPREEGRAWTPLFCRSGAHRRTPRAGGSARQDTSLNLFFKVRAEPLRAVGILRARVSEEAAEQGARTFMCMPVHMAIYVCIRAHARQPQRMPRWRLLQQWRR